MHQLHQLQAIKSKQSKPPGARRDPRPLAAPASEHDRWMELQRGVGNQAVSRMLQRRAVGRFAETQRAGGQLRINETVDAHEQQADRVADGTFEHAAPQRKEDVAPTVTLGSSEETTLSIKYSAHEGEDLRNNLWDLASKNVTDYVTYRDAISRSTAIEKRVALNTVLLSKIKGTLAPLSFARCVELLGRKAPTFDELRKNSVVAEAIKDAWNASSVGTRDLVSQPHEEGGWIFLNLIDGTLHIERATPVGGNFITLNPAPDVEDSVVVAIFHTHPFLGGPKAKPSSRDKALDDHDGVPDLVAANTGTDPKVFRI
jgi:hypothetical protein